MSYHFHSSLYRITKAVRFQPCHFWVSKKRLSCFLAAFPENHWFWPMWMYYWGGGVCLDNVTLPARLVTRNRHRPRHHGLIPVHLAKCLFLLSLPFLCVAYSCAVVDKKDHTTGAIHTPNCQLPIMPSANCCWFHWRRWSTTTTIIYCLYFKLDSK